MALTDSLIAYWKLDEASGNALDAHGSNNLTEGGTVGSATGKINNGRDFESGDGADQFSLADNTDLSTGDIDFSFSFWYNPESQAATHVIIFKSTAGDVSGTQQEYAVLLSGGNFSFRVSTGADLQTVSTSGLSAANGTWYHIVCWHDSVGNVIGIAANAGTAVTQAHSTGVQDSTGTFRFGNDTSGSRWADGVLDEVGFWKRVLTSQERTDLYNSGNGLSYDNFGGAAGQPTSRRFGLCQSGLWLPTYRPIEIGREGVLIA